MAYYLVAIPINAVPICYTSDMYQLYEVSEELVTPVKQRRIMPGVDDYMRVENLAEAQKLARGEIMSYSQREELKNRIYWDNWRKEND